LDFEVNTEKIVEKAIINDSLLSESLHGLLSKKDEVRSKNFKILLQISKLHPEILYLKWDFLLIY
jgi:hypothetical protein